MKFYGQQGEDMLAWELFKSSPPGFYVDVGAFDGVLFSNTYVFEQQGWNGLCFEANSATYDLLRKNRKCTSLRCIVGEQLSLAEPFEFGSYDGISKRTINANDPRVPMLTLNYALTIFGIEHVDYVSIDVESWEREVLAGFDIDKYNPRLVIIEDNDCYQEMYNYFAQHGYTLAKHHYFNNLYVKDTADVAPILALHTNMENGQLMS